MFALAGNVNIIREYSISKFQALSAEDGNEEDTLQEQNLQRMKKASPFQLATSRKDFCGKNLVGCFLVRSGRDQLLVCLKLSRIFQANKYAAQIFYFANLV